MSKQSFPALLEKLQQLQSVNSCYLTSQPTGEASWGSQEVTCGSFQADCQTSFKRTNLSPKGHTDFWSVVWRIAIYAQMRTF